jgi:hypothetical protein
MALDEPRDNDESYTFGDFTYLIEKDLLEKVQPVKVDFSGFGFRIDCDYDFGGGSACSGCGSSSSCG